MSAFLHTVRDWLAGEGRPHSRRERAAVLVLVALAVIGLAFSFRWLTLGQQVVLWAIVLVTLAVAARQGWLKIFGPVLFYDMVRSARRMRFVIVRTLYALFIAFILCWMYLIYIMQYGWLQPHERMAEFAGNFLYAFLFIQYLVVLLLTPAYTAGAVAEEKERKTLQFILATDLRNREIILGKVASRLFNLGLLLLAGVPVLSFLQFLGGVDFYLVLASFAATALTMFSLAGLSMVNSVLCRRARDAIVLTYLMAVAYYILATSAWIGLMAVTMSGWWPELGSFPSFGSWQSPVTVSDLVDWLNAGNIIFVVFKLGRGASASAVFDQELPGILGAYAVFHTLAGMACLGWSILRLRVLALRDDVRRVVRKKGARVRGGSRPRVGRFPMIWKEVFAEGGLRLNALGRVVVGVLFCASFLPVILALWAHFDHSFNRMTWEDVRRTINGAQMRFVGTVVATLMLLAVVVRAAGSIHSERERNTFDELLTTRLTNSEILFGKWLGAMLSVRWGWVWLGIIWLVSLVLGGVEWYGLPLILVSWVVYAAVSAGVGLWFSVGARSSLRATVAALVTMMFLYGGHWLLTGVFCYFPLAMLRGLPERSYEWMYYLQGGQSPPFVMGLFAYHYEDFHRNYSQEWMIKITMASLFGVGCWAALVPVLWLLVKHRFEKVTGRTPHLRPELSVPRRRRPVAKKALVVDAAAGDGQILTVLPVDEKEPDGQGPAPVV